MHRGVKLLEHAMKVVVKVVEKMLTTVVTTADMQFGSMPGKGTSYAVFTLRRIQEDCLAKQKLLCMCFVDLEEEFDRLLRIGVKLAMRKKGILEALVTAVMSLCRSARTKVKVFEVGVRVHLGSVLSPLLFAIVVDVVANEIKEGMYKKYCTRMI